MLLIKLPSEFLTDDDKRRLDEAPLSWTDENLAGH
jgi:hypothetical protein